MGLSLHSPSSDALHPPDLSRRWRVFSLWCPTALQRLYKSLHLSDDAMELVARRVCVVTAIAWLPLFLLAAFSGHIARHVNVPFDADLDLQARLLVALPLLITGEVIVHRRMPLAVRPFVERGIVMGASRVSFDSYVSSALRLSRSPLIDCVLLVGAYTLGTSIKGSISTLSGSSWYGIPNGGSLALTPAGWWYVIVSRPLFQFILLRWYFRLLLWTRFLFEVGRLRLHLLPAHPDRRGGLGFVFALSFAFGPFLFAHGAMLAGRVGNGILHAGMTLRSYEVELFAVPAIALLFVLASEFVFVFALWKAKRKGLADYGALAQRYVRAFDYKWLHHQTPVPEPLLGTADLQSLADLANSYDIIREMRVWPARETITTLTIMTVLPLAPLPLFVMSSRELLERIANVMF